jgi:hypothetical protein
MAGKVLTFEEAAHLSLLIGSRGDFFKRKGKLNNQFHVVNKS